mgnify:CR=1 FL=1
MSIFFSPLIGCIEVTPVGKRIRKKWDLPPGQSCGLLVLGGAFLLGGIVGCVWAVLAGGEGGQALCDYLVDYLSLVGAEEQLPSGIWTILWGLMKYVLIALILGLTALGVVGLPVLFGIRGFLLCFSVGCFLRIFGGQGLFPAFALLGLPSLLWVPAFFLVGTQGLLSAQQLLRRSWGDGRGTLPFSRNYWFRAVMCVGITALCGMLELWVVPVLLRAAAQVVL